MKLTKYFLIFCNFSLTFGLSSFTIDEKIHSCNNGSLNYFDISTINITAINDTYTVVNGKLKILKLISRPWRFALIGERYDRGKWNLMLQRKVENFCDHILNPLE